MPNLNEKLARFAKLPLSELRQEWTSVYKSDAPNVSAELLRHGIAYRLQERSLGGLSSRTLARLTGTTDNAASLGPSLNPGTQLVRGWNGKTITVSVTENGFLFDDRHYKSLSAIARAVTGAHWSGPRFFGLAAHD